MTNYKQLRDEAGKVFYDIRKEYHEKMNDSLSQKISNTEDAYIFYLTGKIEIPKENFEMILGKVKNQKVREDILESWIRELEIFGWNAKVEEEKIVFGRRMK